MKWLKKIYFTLFCLVWLSTFVIAQNDFYYETNPNNTTYTDNLEIWKIVKWDAIKPSQSILNKMLKLFWLNTTTYNQWPQKAIFYLKMILNIILGLVSFISLILIIYSFYLMFFVKEEEWFTKAKKTLTWVFIALAIMWLSRFIVNLIFYIYQKYVL